MATCKHPNHRLVFSGWAEPGLAGTAKMPHETWTHIECVWCSVCGALGEQLQSEHTGKRGRRRWYLPGAEPQHSQVVRGPVPA